MPLTYLLAQLMGIYLLVVGCTMLFSKKNFMQVANEMMKSAAMLYLVGFLAFLLGLIMVLTHNIWNGGALPLVITLCGWALVLKGFFLMISPYKTSLQLTRAIKFEEMMWLYAVVLLVLGAYLTYAGFMR